MFEKLFGDMGDIGNFMSSLTQAANQKAIAAKETAAVNVREKGLIADSATNYEMEAKTALDKLHAINGKGEQARQMAESNNIVDRITLMGEQILDPRNFTAKGRENQIGEQSQYLSAVGQTHNIEVNASAARIDEAQAKEIAATAGLDAKMGILRTTVDGLQLMNGAIAQTETLRQQNLAVTDLPTLQKVLMGPKQPQAGGKFVVNGMTYTPAELQEREKNLTTRNQLAMLSPQATDPDFAQKLRVHQDLQLANYSLPELQTLKQNGYIMQDGTQVEPGLWDQHYTRQNALQQDALQVQMNSAMLENQVPVMLKESTALATNLAPYATPGSPIAIARNGFLAAANNVATLAAADTTPNGKMVQVKSLEAAQNQLIKAVDVEASKKAGGDQALANIYRSQMLGQEIQPAQVEDVIRTRYTKGAGFGDVLPNEAALRIRKNADTIFAKKQQANNGLNDPMSSPKSAKEMKEESINEAMEQERAEAGITGVNLIQRNVGKRTDNPAIKTGMVPAQLDEMQVRAHTIALDNVMHANGISQEQIMAIKAGRPQDAGITPEKASMLAQQVNMESVMAEYDLYEKQKPGLGYEMQQWYSTVMPEMARNYTASLDPIQQTLTGDSVITEAQKLGTMYTMADESASDRAKKMAIEQSTGIKHPETMWPILLQSSTRLADSERSSLYYDVVMPAIKQARAAGANDAVTTSMIFDSLNNFKSDDKALSASVRNFMHELPGALDHFDNTWKFAFRQNRQLGKALLSSSNKEVQGANMQGAYPWMNQ
jgi:hypothetical protein